MSHTRRTALAAAAVTAGIAALLVAPQTLPASATPHATSLVATPRVGQALIQGVVVDQTGNPVDDVTVQAYDEDGEPAASDQTYANQVEDGPQHGYFALHVSRGTYTLKLARDGYKPLVVDELQIARARQKISLGAVEITKLLPETKTVAALVGRTVTTKQNGEVAVTVSARGAVVTGLVEVFEGRDAVGQGRLKASNKGGLTIVLERLPKGAHVLKAHYAGSSSLRESTSKTFTLVVTKGRH